jgi:hypothetical protein
MPVTLTKEQEKKFKKQFELDHQMIKGKFSFLEVPGGELRFSYQKYDKDPLMRYKLKDGETYELPYMVAKHLAQDVKYPVHSFQQDEFGKPIMAVGRMVHRTAFQRLDFDDNDFIPSKIVTAEAVVI